MGDIAIHAENLCKRYRLGEFIRYRTLRETLTGVFQRTSNKKKDKELWAVQDVSFDIKRGEVVGIIGRNGAGKSTLLKLLSRITKPTHGKADIYGRVGSLLEVGTGFHPELTGRENIFLNGAILGMTRGEIQAKFHEIVSFAEMEQFLDTPVKRYSSGMHVRLAFAVAAHLEPEILIIDEVLSVGDAEFQKRCLGRMNDVSREGRTVLVVSHNMATIENLTTRCILVDGGSIVFDGSTEEAIEEYYRLFQFNQDSGGIDLSQLQPTTEKGERILTRIELLVNGRPTTDFRTGDDISFAIYFRTRKPVKNPKFGIAIDTLYGARVASFSTFLSGVEVPNIEGQGSIVCKLGATPLNEGVYGLKVVVRGSTGEEIEVFERALQFTVHTADIHNSGRAAGSARGVIVWPCTWSVT